MSEFRFVFARRIPTGRVVFKVVNGGQLPHRLTLIELPDDAPPIEELVKAEGGLDVQPVAQMRELAPNGDYDSFAFELKPGQHYAMVSLVSTPEGKVDAELGMTAELRTPGRPTTTTTTPR